jgi:hypothetical protein
MEWNKLHLQECSQDKERNGAERNGENLQLVWNGINCISKNVHRIKNGTERNEMEKYYNLYGMSKNVNRIKNGTERNEMEKTYNLYGME